jgi:ribonuclease HI
MGEFISDGYYCDGGIIGRNDAAKAGTWAWVKIVDGREVASNSGIIVVKGHAYPDEVAGFTTEEPSGLEKIGNNLTELLAAVEALEFANEQQVKLLSDNKNAIGRLTLGWACNGVPEWLMERVGYIKSSMQIEAQLLSGHPSADQLKEGVGPRVYPNSKWNVWCDKECKRLAKLFKDNQ